jgi:putative transposase
LTGLVRSTASRRRTAATTLTPAVCTEPAVEPAQQTHRCRTAPGALVEQLGVDLQRREIDEPVAGEHLKDVYLCSVSTMYRVLGENTLVAERRRLARHPSQVCPELNWTHRRLVRRVRL